MAALCNFLLRRSPSCRGTNLSTRGLFLLPRPPRSTDYAASISCLGGEWWRSRGDATTRYVSKLEKNFKWNLVVHLAFFASNRVEIFFFFFFGDGKENNFILFYFFLSKRERFFLFFFFEFCTIFIRKKGRIQKVLFFREITWLR